MKRSLVVLSAVCLAWAGVAGAAVHKGEIDLSISGTWFTEQSDNGGQDFDGAFVSGSVGIFLSDCFEFEPAALGIWTSGNPTTPYLNDQDERFYALGTKLKFYPWPHGRCVPYFGGQVFWGKYHRDAPGELYDTDLDGTLAGPLAGLRFELVPNVSFFVEYQYHFWFGEVSEARFNDIDAPISPNWDEGQLVTLGLIYSLR